MSYKNMLKKIKSGKDMENDGDSINAITKTKDGHLRIVLGEETSNVEDLTTALTRIIGNEVSCTKLSDTAIIEIRDADEEALDE